MAAARDKQWQRESVAVLTAFSCIAILISVGAYLLFRFSTWPVGAGAVLATTGCIAWIPLHYALSSRGGDSESAN